MKHLFALALCASITLGFSSCVKEICYECTHPDKCAVDICDERASVDNDGLCVLVPDKDGSDNIELKNAYEAEGYTCRIK